MLTLTRRRGWSIYSLSHEGVSGKGIHGLRPESLHAGRPEVPGRAGSSGLRKFRAGSGRVPGYPESWRARGWSGLRGPEVPGRPEGPGAGSSGQRPEVPGFPEACPCFFFLLLFHAWPWSLDPPWSSRLYLSVCKVHA